VEWHAALWSAQTRASRDLGGSPGRPASHLLASLRDRFIADGRGLSVDETLGPRSKKGAPGASPEAPKERELEGQSSLWTTRDRANPSPAGVPGPSSSGGDRVSDGTTGPWNADLVGQLFSPLSRHPRWPPAPRSARRRPSRRSQGVATPRARAALARWPARRRCDGPFVSTALRPAMRCLRRTRTTSTGWLSGRQKPQPENGRACFRLPTLDR